MGTALDVAIGVVFVYLLLALIVTTVQELIASLLSLRAKHLYSAIETMLKKDAADSSGSELVRKFYTHSLLKNLVEEALPQAPTWYQRLTGAGLPSYIPSKTFALVLLDVLQNSEDAAGNPLLAHPSFSGIEDLFNNAKSIVEKATLHSDLKHSLLLVLEKAKDKTHTKAEDWAKAVGAASDRVEGLFNDRMARAAGWYKRKMQVLSLILALAVSASFNADTLSIANELWKNSTLREQVVAAAQTYRDAQGAPKGSPAEPDPTKVSALATSLVTQSDALLNLGLPLGWQTKTQPPAASLCCRVYQWFLRLLGWLITTLAVSLGAAFWFDVLSKALQLRGSGPKVSAVTGEVEGRGR